MGTVRMIFLTVEWGCISAGFTAKDTADVLFQEIKKRAALWSRQCFNMENEKEAASQAASFSNPAKNLDEAIPITQTIRPLGKSIQ